MMAEHGTREPAAEAQNPQVADRLISIREIRQLFGLGRTAAYELTHRPGFPAPVRISPRCYRWWAEEVNAFAASLCEQVDRDNAARRRTTGHTPSAWDTSALRITGKVRAARSRRKPS